MSIESSWDPDRDRAGKLQEEAFRLDEAGERSRAIELCREAVALDPGNFRVRTFLGTLLGESPSQRREGIRVLRGALESFPDNPIVLASLGRLVQEDGGNEEAYGLLQRSLALSARSTTCIYLGVTASALNRDQQAQLHYRRALEIEPDDDEAHYNLGCQLRFEDPAAAERHFRRAVEIDPLYSIAWGQLGHVLLLAGRDSEAADALHRSISLEPEDFWHRLRLALVLGRLERWADARPHLQHALRLRHLASGAYPTGEVVDCLESGLASDRSAVWGRIYHAVLLDLHGDFDAALGLLEGVPKRAGHAELSRAIRADQAMARAEGLDADQSELVLELLEFAVAQEPTHPGAWETLGERLYRIGIGVRFGGSNLEFDATEHFERAQRALDQAIALNPDAAFSHTWLGLVHKQLGDADTAEAELRRAIECGSDPVHAVILGDHFVNLGRFGEAEAIFEQTLEDYPECGLTWRSYGIALMVSGNPGRKRNKGRALHAFEKAVELDPETAESHYRLGNLLACKGAKHLPRAKALLERSLVLKPDHSLARENLADVEADLRELGGDD